MLRRPPFSAILARGSPDGPSFHKGSNAVRILHTSDWHLGQTLHSFDRDFEHERFLAWLLTTLAREAVDALLVAGDIFDSANPSASCQRRLFEFLAAARRAQPELDIVLVAGNHDSPGRLEAPSPLLAAFGVKVVGQPLRQSDGSIDLQRLVVPLSGRDGAVAAWCLALPFLRPGDVPRVDTPGDAYAAGIAQLYREVLAVALEQRQPGQAIIATGHCHMVGGKLSEQSERRIVIGGAEALPADLFDPAIAYAALGHLHLAQQVGHAHHRYSGSPLPLSFAEIDYPHQVLVLDLVGEVVGEIRALRVPRAVDLLRVPANAAPIEDVLAALRALDLPDMAEDARPYLEVRVRLDAPEPALRSRIEAALEGKPVRLARIDTRDAATTTGAATIPASLDAIERLEPGEVFGRIYRQKYADEAPAALRAAFDELLLEAAGEDEP
jgi:exonuclease SbcD